MSSVESATNIDTIGVVGRYAYDINVETKRDVGIKQFHIFGTLTVDDILGDCKAQKTRFENENIRV